MESLRPISGPECERLTGPADGRARLTPLGCNATFGGCRMARVLLAAAVAPLPDLSAAPGAAPDSLAAVADSLAAPGASHALDLLLALAAAALLFILFHRRSS